MKKTTILFDFDGTIGDSSALVIDLFNKHAKEYGLLPVNSDEVQVLRSMNYHEIIKKYKIPFYKIPFIIGKLRGEFSSRMHEIPVMAGVGDVIKTLKKRGYTLGIVTSNEHKNVSGFLREHSLEYFDFIHSELNIFGKSRALNHVLRSRKLQQDEVLYIGDEVRDIEACKKVGIDIISVTYGYNTKEALQKFSPTYIAQKPEDILTILT